LRKLRWAGRVADRVGRRRHRLRPAEDVPHVEPGLLLRPGPGRLDVDAVDQELDDPPLPGEVVGRLDLGELLPQRREHRGRLHQLRLERLHDVALGLQRGELRPQRVALGGELAELPLGLVEPDALAAEERHHELALGLLLGELALQRLAPVVGLGGPRQAAAQLGARLLERLAWVEDEAPHVPPDPLLEPLGRQRLGMAARRRVGPHVRVHARAPVVVVRRVGRPPRTDDRAAVVEPAAAADHQPAQEVGARRASLRPAEVALQPGPRRLGQLVADERWDLGGERSVPAVQHVGAGVERAADHLREARREPGRRLLGAAAGVAAPRRDPERVEPQALLDQACAAGGAREDVADDVGLGHRRLPDRAVARYEPAGRVAVVAERDRAARPAPLAHDPVAAHRHPLGDRAALELGQAAEQLEEELPDRGRRVERLGRRPDRHAGPLERVVRVEQRPQGAAQAVEPVGDDLGESPGPRVGDQPGARRPLIERDRPRDPVVDVLVGDVPAVRLRERAQQRQLRLDRPAVGLVLGRDAGVDRDTARDVAGEIG
jgi:hypothetical protein